MKKCPNGHENPDYANFCRMCRHEFTHDGDGKKSNEAPLHEEIYKLQRVCDKLHQENTNMKDEVASLTEENAMLKEETSSIIQELEHTRDKLHYEWSFREDLQKTIKELKNELSNIRESAPPKTPPIPKAGSSSYTPTAFPGINFTPRSMFNPHFRIFLWFFLMVIGVGGIVLYSIVLSEDVRDEFGEVMDVALYTGMGVVTYLFLLMLCVRIAGAIVFKFYAAFVEKAPMSNVQGKFHRIGKKCKLGLFDAKTKMVRLKPQYDSIEKFDANHLLIKISGKAGLYSIPRKKVIIPVKYDSIGAFNNFISEATWSGGKDHYDTKGNLII